MRVSVKGLLGARAAGPIAEVTHQDLQAAVGALGLAPGTVRTYFLDVATLCNYAVRRQYLARSPAQFIELPTVASVAQQIHARRTCAGCWRRVRALACDVAALALAAW